MYIKGIPVPEKKQSTDSSALHQIFLLSRPTTNESGKTPPSCRTNTPEQIRQVGVNTQGRRGPRTEAGSAARRGQGAGEGRPGSTRGMFCGLLTLHSVVGYGHLRAVRLLLC